MIILNKKNDVRLSSTENYKLCLLSHIQIVNTGTVKPNGTKS